MPPRSLPPCGRTWPGEDLYQRCLAYQSRDNGPQRICVTLSMKEAIGTAVWEGIAGARLGSGSGALIFSYPGQRGT